MGSALVLENVTKSYGKKTVLKDISFCGNSGEFIVLVGPSGCGKSTALRTIAGLESIDHGKILIDDLNVTDKAPKDRDIAMVFQDYALYPHKTVYENIAFGLRIRGLDQKEIHQRVEDAAQRLGLIQLLDRKPSALSGGQRQRVAIGRAIVRRPTLFLFDEPLSNLDAQLRGSMRLFISKLHKELGKTVVYVTHDQVEAMTLADRIVVLHQGVIQQVGAPLELYQSPKNIFVATFIGSPPMNLIKGEVKHEGSQLYFVSDHGLKVEVAVPEGKTLKAKPGTKVIWGVRPEDFKGLRPEHKHNNFVIEVSVRELLGSNTLVIGAIGKDEDIHVSLRPNYMPEVGTKFNLHYESKHLYLFDAETEESLLS